MYDKILVPFDGSEQSLKGLDIACMLAEHCSAKLILLVVVRDDIPSDAINAAVNEGIVRPSGYMAFSQSLQDFGVSAARAAVEQQAFLERAAVAIAEEVVERGARFAREQNIPEVMTLVRDGDPAKSVLQVSTDHGTDLIVIGSHGNEGLDALFHPSVAEHVRKHSTCPCVIHYPSRSD